MSLTLTDTPTPYDGHTLAAEEIANTVVKEEEAKIAAIPQETKLSGSMRDMVGPDGKVYSMPIENLGKAEGLGFRLQTPEEIGADAYIKEHPAAAAASAFARGVLNGPTLGVLGDEQVKWLGKNLPTWLGGGLTENQVNVLAKTWEKKHGALLAGDIVGMVASLPVAAGVAGAGAKLAVGTEGLIAAGGGRAVAGHAIRGAMEGLALTTGQAVREWAEGDPKHAAETVAWGVGTGFLLGGGFQAASEAAAAMKEPVAAGGSSVADGHWAKSIGGPPTRKVFNTAAENIPGGHKEVARFINEDFPILREKIMQGKESYDDFLEKTIKPVIFERMPRTPEEIASFTERLAQQHGDPKLAQQLVDFKVRWGETPEVFYETMDTALKSVLESGDAKRINEVLAARGMRGPARPGEAPHVNVHIDSFDSQRFLKRVTAETTEEANSPFLSPFIESIQKGELSRFNAQAGLEMADGEALSFQKVWKWRQHLDELAYKEARAQSPRVEELRKVRGILQDELEKQGAEIGNALGKYDERFARALPELEQANHNYRKFAAWKTGVEDAAMRASTNRSLQLSEYGTGIASAVASAALGSPAALAYGVGGSYIHKFLREKGHGMIARAFSAMPMVEGSMAGMGKRMMLLPKAIEGALPEAIPAHRIIPAQVFSEWMPAAKAQPKVDGAPSKDDDDTTNDHVRAYVKFADELTELATNPARMQQRLDQIMKPLMAESPTVALAVAQHYQSMVNHLMEIMPRYQRASTSLGTPMDPYISKTALDKFAQRVALTQNPLLAKDFLSTRTLTKEHLETLFKVWPSTYRTLVLGIQAHASSPQAKPLDYRGQIATSQMLGIAIVPQMKGKAIAGYQQVYVTEAMGGAPGSAGIPGGKTPTNLKGPSFMTDPQRISAGRSK